MDHLRLFPVGDVHARLGEPGCIGARIVAQRIEIGAGNIGRGKPGQVRGPQRVRKGLIRRCFQHLAVIVDVGGGKQRRLGHLDIGAARQIAAEAGIDQDLADDAGEPLSLRLQYDTG